ncbi:MAG: hypothetical protein ACRDBG_22560, partial [Waterburya sp.]
MANRLDLLFQNGAAHPVDASQLNAIVTVINELVTELNNVNSLLERISKSELVVLARKNLTMSFPADGQLRNISSWNVQLNKDEIFNSATGITTIKQSGTYTTVVKTLVSGDNVASPRSKLTIYYGGQEKGLDEDTTFQALGTLVQNYRRALEANVTDSINVGQNIIPN